MRNLFENIAVTLVILLSLIIVALIVKYNTIEEETEDKTSYQIPSVKEVTKKETTSKYLQEMEKYNDKDINIDPTLEDNVNRVKVKSENAEDVFDKAVEDNYLKKLENYGNDESANEETKVELETVEAALPQAKVEDEIGNAIDDVLK